MRSLLENLWHFLKGGRTAGPDGPLTVLKPTREQVDDGLSELQRCIPSWMASPALLVVKPHIGIVVSVQHVAHDDDGFTLSLVVKEALVTPADFEATRPIEVRCAWNQPYMSIDAHCISAPYSFYLHFGVEGVNRAREVSLSFVGKEKNGEILLGYMRACFSEGFSKATAIDAE